MCVCPHASDCLSLLVYKEKKKGKEKGSGHKERLSVTLEVGAAAGDQRLAASDLKCIEPHLGQV